MDFFKKREISAILAEHDTFGNNTFIAKAPKYAEYILHILLGKSIAEDFQIADKEFIEDENERISFVSNSFTNKWFVFALSGQGDYWLLNNSQNTIGFYDHNRESFAINDVQELGITLEDWVVLGDLFHQYDLLNEFTPSAFNDDYTLKYEYKIDFIDRINSIKRDLSEIMPFNVV